MKFFGNIIALAGISGAAAFSIQGPIKSSVTALYSSNPKSNDVFAADTVVPVTAETTEEVQSTKSILDVVPLEIVHGESLRTWSLPDDIERAQIVLKTDGRPLNALVEMWKGPDYTPVYWDIYLENGKESPFRAVVKFPKGYNTVAVRNTANAEFPLSACVEGDDLNDPNGGLSTVVNRMKEIGQPETFQGANTVKSYSFHPSVESVQILFNTEGRAFQARIEVLQGPNNLKQVIKLKCAGKNIPFYAIFEIPGPGTMIRIVNTSELEFPFTASIEPYFFGDGGDTKVSIGGV